MEDSFSSDRRHYGYRKERVSMSGSKWMKTVDFLAHYTLTALWWLLALSTVAMVINVGHNMKHNYDKYAHEIESDQEYVKSFCSNDTLVRVTKRYEECEKARFVASLDPMWEAVTSTVEKMHLCARETNPHSVYAGANGHSHGMTDASFSHCDHAYYILFGAAIAVVACLFVLKRCII